MARMGRPIAGGRALAVLALALVLAVGLLGGSAGAHGVSLGAGVSIQGREVLVKLFDTYGAAVPGATVTASVESGGKRVGKPVRLVEGTPGTYRGVFPAAGAGAWELDLEVTLGSDLFTGYLRLDGPAELTDRTVPLQAVEPDQQKGFSWTPYLYGGAVIVLVTVTGYTMLRRRQADSGEE